MRAPQEIVETRQEMARLLDDRMTRTYAALRGTQALERDSSLVKTYLVEAQLSEESSSADAWTLVERAFGIALDHREAAGELHRAEEPSLASVAVRYRQKRLVFYVDFTNPRFWRLHTMGASDVADWIVGRLTWRIAFLDRAWLPPDLLEVATQLGSFRGLGLDYDKRPFDVEPDDEQQETVSFLKVQLWGNKARDVLELLRRDGAFPHQTTLAKVKVKYWLSADDLENFSLDDVKYDGKLTARGTSFQSHLELTSRLYESYATEIRRIEAKSIRWTSTDEGLSLSGEPLDFGFSEPISDIGEFCERIVRAGSPFRLWGVPVRVREDLYRVAAFDLHVARPISFEVRPRSVRVFLPEGGCGNSILRLYTNLQHHFDSIVRATQANGEPLFGF